MAEKLAYTDQQVRDCLDLMNRQLTEAPGEQPSLGVLDVVHATANYVPKGIGELCVVSEAWDLARRYDQHQ